MRNWKYILIAGTIFLFSLPMFIKYVQTANPIGGLYKKEIGSGNSLDSNASDQEVHYHAGFVVFDNAKKVDFSDIKYMHVEPCSIGIEEKSEEETPEHKQIEKAHLHDGIGDVVHVHGNGAKWGDLFTNIKYPIDYSNTTAYADGQKIDELKDYPIKPDASIVIFVGRVDTNLMDEAVTAEQIREAESRSESCGTK